MPDTIDSIAWPKPSEPHRGGRRTFLIFLILVAVIFFGGRTATSTFVDLLWFRSLGYAGVFWRTLGLQWGLFAGFAVLTFAFGYGVFLALRRVHRGEMPSGHTVFINGQPLKLSVEPVIRIGTLIGSLLIAGITGAAMMSEWTIFALFWHAPRATGEVVDPIWGKSLNFYLFTLPTMQLMLGWLLTLALIGCALAILFLFLTGSTRAFGDHGRSGSLSWRGLNSAVAFLMTVVALRVYVGRFEQLFDHHTIFEGVSYTDAHVLLTGKLFLCAALLIGALLAVVNAVRNSSGRWLIGVLAPAVVCYIVLGLVGWYVGNFIVKPNELVREQPYISHNIEMTRQAFGLDKFAQREFPAETTVGATDPANNQPTLQNIRLWDWHALQDTLRQIQEIRTYYDFPDIDIDRYDIGGVKREVMLATRELNVDKLPESSRNWINDRLIYTHGYGITMNPVNGFTSEGLPTLMLSNMPVQSTVPELAVKRPEVYFGELTDSDVYVKTRQQEFNYPQGQTNSLTSYEGTGGIVLGGFFRRLILAFDRGDLGKLPFSDDVNPESRLLMRRNVRERVATLAPFLTFDHDPYVVLGEDGRLSWIMDGFTSSDHYPYSTQYQFGSSTVNYMRNSVKAVIDAYDGTTAFYVFDNDDPVLAGYRNIFPSLFKDAATMPSGLRKHVRYPELLLKLQAEVYGLYHMTDPEVFYNREDLWTVATEVGMADGGEQTTQVLQPNYVLMKLPGESDVEFVEILPFTPANRNNLVGWIAGRSDGEHYGTSVVYNFPKTRLVDGPLQIEARIDQNAQLSGQFTLWNQQGSSVIRGHLLVIPIGRSLVYVEPIYLKAERSPMPELRLVVLATQEKLAYGQTFGEAMNGLFGEAAQTAPPSSSSGQAPPPEGGAPAPSATPSATLQQLVDRAIQEFDDYQRLVSQGKFAEAGQKLEQHKRTLEEIRKLNR